MYTPIKIYFFHYLSKVNAIQEAPIYCRVIQSNKRKQFSTGIFCMKGQFIKAKGIIKENHLGAELSNRKLAELKSNLNALILEYRIKGFLMIIGGIEEQGTRMFVASLLIAFICYSNRKGLLIKAELIKHDANKDCSENEEGWEQ